MLLFYRDVGRGVFKLVVEYEGTEVFGDAEFVMDGLPDKERLALAEFLSSKSAKLCKFLQGHCFGLPFQVPAKVDLERRTIHFCDSRRNGQEGVFLVLFVNDVLTMAENTLEAHISDALARLKREF